MTKLVKCGEFVKRQTPDSGFSHFEGSWEELEYIVTDILSCQNSDVNRIRPGYKDGVESYTSRIRPGYKDGIILIDLDNLSGVRFYSAIVDLNKETKLNASYAPRRVDEAPFIRLSAKGNKQVAKSASVVLYRADVLNENNERETDADWEIVAIKARTSDEEEPMDPYTMARNFLHLKGGTKGDFTAEQFAKSILYWNNHCMAASKSKWYKRVSNFFKNILFSIKKSVKLSVNNICDGFWD